MTNIKDDIRLLLADEFGIEDLEEDTPLISGKILDSMSVLTLITLLESKYNIKISPLDMSIDMFDSINEISKLVTRLS